MIFILIWAKKGLTILYKSSIFYPELKIQIIKKNKNKQKNTAFEVSLYQIPGGVGGKILLYKWQRILQKHPSSIGPTEPSATPLKKSKESQTMGPHQQWVYAQIFAKIGGWGWEKKT